MGYDDLRDNLLELIRRTSAYLPPDVEEVIDLKRGLETKGSMAQMAMDMIVQNVGLAKARSLPICQDTGTITFYVDCPVGYDQLQFIKAAEEAVVMATAATPTSVIVASNSLPGIASKVTVTLFPSLI